MVTAEGVGGQGKEGMGILPPEEPEPAEISQKVIGRVRRHTDRQWRLRCRMVV